MFDTAQAREGEIWGILQRGCFVMVCFWLIAILFECCGGHEVHRSPQAAKAELLRLGIPYDQRTFVKNAKDGDSRVLHLFLDAGMDPDARGDSGATALMEASRSGNVALVDMLLVKGSNVTLVDDEGATALHGAAESPYGYRCVEVLLENGAIPDARTATGETPLVKSLGFPLADPATEFLVPNYIRTIRALLARGADVNVRYGHGFTPLMRAAIGGNPQIVRLLLDHGANVKAATGNGETAETLALRHNNIDIATIIKEAGG